MIAASPGSLGACPPRRRRIANPPVIGFVHGLMMLSGLLGRLCGSLELYHLSSFSPVSLWACVPALGPLCSCTVPFIHSCLTLFSAQIKKTMLFVNLAIIYAPCLNLAYLLTFCSHVS